MQLKLNLFHVKRVSNVPPGGCQMFVVYCENENVARNTNPGGEWVDNTEELIVEQLPDPDPQDMYFPGINSKLCVP